MWVDVCCNSSECFTTSSWEATPSLENSTLLLSNLISLSALCKSWKKSKEETLTLNMVKSGSRLFFSFSRVLACFDVERVRGCSSSCRERWKRRAGVRFQRCALWQLNLPGGTFAFLTPPFFKMQIRCLKSIAKGRGWKSPLTSKMSEVLRVMDRNNFLLHRF